MRVFVATPQQHPLHEGVNSGVIMPTATVPKSAIVTGGAAGIGAEVALLLAQRGFSLTLLDLDLKALEATAAAM